MLIFFMHWPMHPRIKECVLYYLRILSMAAAVLSLQAFPCHAQLEGAPEQPSPYVARGWRFTYTDHLFTANKVGDAKVSWQRRGWLGVRVPEFFPQLDRVVIFDGNGSHASAFGYSLAGKLIWKRTLPVLLESVCVVRYRIVLAAHNINIPGVWTPGPDGLSIDNLLLTDHVVEVFEARNGKIDWRGSPNTYGLPVISLPPSEFISIRNINSHDHYAHDLMSKYAIEARRTRDGKLLCGWILPLWDGSRQRFSQVRNGEKNDRSSGKNIPTWDYWDSIYFSFKYRKSIVYINVQGDEFSHMPNFKIKVNLSRKCAMIFSPYLRCMLLPERQE